VVLWREFPQNHPFCFSALIITGVLLLFSNLAGALFGFYLRQLWPVLVLALGCCFVLPPLFATGKRGLGGLFIPTDF